MPTIAIVNTKGGVSKTTSALWLAACATYRGHHVRLVDADSQGTATAWLNQVLDDRPDTDVELVVANMATLSRLPADGVTIIDTPPGDPAVIDRAVRNADFVVVPAAPSLAELDRIWDTLSIISDNIPAAVLLTQVNSQAVLFAQVRDTLDDEGVLVFPTPIPRREMFRQAFGTWPDNDSRVLVGYDDAFDHIMEGLQ